MFNKSEKNVNEPVRICNNLSTLRSAKSYAIPADFEEPEKSKYKFDLKGHIKARKR